MRPDSETPPQSFLGTARREQITRAAIEVLASEGYAATSLSAIAIRIGVSKGNLSYHFASKAELLRAVVNYVLESAAAWLTPRIAGATSYREALHTYISANLSYLAAHRTDILALTEILANARATPGVPDIFAASQEDAIRNLSGLFEAGQHAGEFGNVPATMLAISLRATIDSTSQGMRADPEFDLVAFERDLTSLFDRATARPRDETNEKGEPS
ncbi:MAG TPA: TetR/AcrR family transcriptional regulator [Galbitalea sp.]|nr:TetR/AcrR family transcriptional regulator [Galbitalea sp.]